MESGKQITEIKEIQALELDTFKHFLDICEANGLRYYLMGGTLLGAIRHKGFIPWDDDIDVGMPRPDYEKFLDITAEPYLNQYKVLSMRSDDKYYVFGKFYNDKTSVVVSNMFKRPECGVFIDIFPLDGIPNGKLSQILMFAQVYFWRSMVAFSISKSGKMQSRALRFVKNSIGPVFRLFKFDYIKILSAYDKTIRRYDFDKFEYIAAACGGSGYREIMPKEEFLKPYEVEFERMKVVAPSCYDYYLRNLYGDYMRLPPEEQRVTHHEFEVFWK